MKNFSLEKLKTLVKEKQRINRKIIIELGLIEDYESEFEKKSKELFGQVKEIYTVQEASQLTGYSKSSIYNFANIGLIKVKRGKVKKEDVFTLFTIAN